MKSYSQFGQDIYVMNNIFKGKREGFFIEAGAYTGIVDSNTYLMEKEFKWKGVCVEPNPCHAVELFKNRKCHCYESALYSEDNKTLEFIDTSQFSAPGIGGFTITNCHKHIGHCPRINVTTRRLDTLLNSVKAPHFIDFLSLDTEGSEFTILEKFDFEKYKFGYICIEHNHVEPGRRDIRQLLEKKGYVFHRENEVDDDYILKDISLYL
jgi:FkbM family methyltransferase